MNTRKPTYPADVERCRRDRVANHRVTTAQSEFRTTAVVNHENQRSPRESTGIALRYEFSIYNERGRAKILFFPGMPATCTAAYDSRTVSRPRVEGRARGDSLPPQDEWSEEEYLVLTEHANGLIEFTDGLLDILPMPTDKHQSVVKFLALAFCSFVEARGGIVQFAPLRLRIRPGNFREPDLLLLLIATDLRRQNRFWLGADRLEVVSEDKPERDLVQKRYDYAEGRRSEYWIVNPQAETITVLRLNGEVYEEAGSYRRGESAASVLLPGFSVDVAAAFAAGPSQG